jgi:hypothetical protein
MWRERTALKRVGFGVDGREAGFFQNQLPFGT